MCVVDIFFEGWGIEIPVKIAYTSIKYTLKMRKHSICGRFMAWFHIHCIRYMLPLFKCKLSEMILCEKRYVQRIWRFSIQTAAAHLKHTFAFHLQTAHLCFVYKFLAKDTLASLYKRYVLWLHIFRSLSDLSVAHSAHSCSVFSRCVLAYGNKYVKAAFALHNFYPYIFNV